MSLRRNLATGSISLFRKAGRNRAVLDDVSSPYQHWQRRNIKQGMSRQMDRPSRSSLWSIVSARRLRKQEVVRSGGWQSLAHFVLADTLCRFAARMLRKAPLHARPTLWLTPSLWHR